MSGAAAHATRLALHRGADEGDVHEYVQRRYGATGRGIQRAERARDRVVGAGIEFPLCESLSLNGEWLFLSFAPLTASGTITNTAGGFGVAANSLDSFFNSRLAFSSNLLRFGVQYRFRSL